MTATQLPLEQDISPARLHGEACWTCGSTEPPLHPDETVPVRHAAGIVRDVATVVCTSDLVVREPQ